MTQSTAPAFRPAELRTGHVGLTVTDLEKSVPFYRAAFGFDVLSEGGDETQRWAFLGRDGRILVTLWEQATATAFAATAAGLHHLSFEVGSIEEVRAAEAVVRELGAPLQYDGVVKHGEGAGSGGIFFYDPDGTRLELYAPTGAESAPAPHEAAPTCGFF